MHRENSHGGTFLVEQDGKQLAEMTYTRTSESLVNIDHTWVDPSLKGQGVGRQLLDAVVQWARQTGTKLSATCSFASAQFAKDPSIRDVLA